MLAPLLLGLAFLVLLCILAVVSLRLFGARNEEGRLTAPGCLGGCAMAAVLSFLGLAGLAALVLALAVATHTVEFRNSLNDAAHEVSFAVREQAEELRRELRDELGDELGDGRSARARRASPTEADPKTAPAPRTWRARVVLGWPGQSDPPLALLEALTKAGLQEPLELALTTSNDEANELRTKATVISATRATGVDALRRAIEAEAARLGAESGLELSVLEVADEDLR